MTRSGGGGAIPRRNIIDRPSRPRPLYYAILSFILTMRTGRRRRQKLLAFTLSQFSANKHFLVYTLDIFLKNSDA